MRWACSHTIGHWIRWDMVIIDYQQTSRGPQRHPRCAGTSRYTPGSRRLGNSSHSTRRFRSDGHDRKRREAAKAAGLTVNRRRPLSEEVMREVARREAMEPMRVQCLNVATNQTASITVMSWKSHSCTQPVCRYGLLRWCARGWEGLARGSSSDGGGGHTRRHITWPGLARKQKGGERGKVRARRIHC